MLAVMAARKDRSECTLTMEVNALLDSRSSVLT